MNVKWTVALCCSFAILGMFLPFDNKMLASLPLDISLTGSAMFGAKGEAALDEVGVAKAVAYLVWSIPFSAALMTFAIAAGPVKPLGRRLVGILWIVVVVLFPTAAIDIASVAMKPLFPTLQGPIAWVGLGLGGWVIVVAGLVMIVSAFFRDNRAPDDEPIPRVDRT